MYLFERGGGWGLCVPRDGNRVAAADVGAERVVEATALDVILQH